MFTKKQISRMFYVLPIAMILLTGVLPVQAQSLASPLLASGNFIRTKSKSGAIRAAGHSALALLPTATITVNSTLDEPDSDVTDGQCSSTPSGKCTLRAAVMQANVVNVDTTILVPSGIYTLTIPPVGPDGPETGDLDLTAPASGSPAITITGAGAGTTIIDANQLDRVFLVNSTRTATISGVTIRNGFLTSGNGGGIFNGGSLTVSDSKISGNHGASSGGGIYNNGTLALMNSTVSQNQASIYGGGISNDIGYLSLINSTLSQNNVPGSSGEGGGIFNNGALQNISNSTISGNSAYYGGGIFNNMSLLMGNSTLSTNNAGLNGGGIYNAGTLNIRSSTISGNNANDVYGDGGGIYNTYSLLLVNSTLSTNNAGNIGGGIYNRSGQTNVDNISILFNYADAYAGGVFNYDAGGAIFNLRNTLVAGSFDSNGVSNDCEGTLNMFGRNLFWDVSGCNVNSGPGSWSNLNSLSTIGPLQNNGGPTMTHMLLPGSSAIDGGDPVQGCIDPNGPLTTDQRGVTRPQGAQCDIGAVEADPTPLTVVSVTRADTNPTSAASVHFTVTFSEAVTGVNTADFSLTKTGTISSASVTGVTGGPTAYIFTVNTGTGNGTIRLDLNASGTGIQDLAGNPIIGGFTGGQVYIVTKVHNLFLPLILR